MTRAAPLVLLLTLLAGCSGNDQPNAAPTATVTVRATETVTASPSPASTLTLRALCDHVPDTFRSGTLPPEDQMHAQADELTGIADTADPAAAMALEPLIDAAFAIAAGDTRARTAAYNRAYADLQATCSKAGSSALDD